jgi:hypothetical protein
MPLLHVFSFTLQNVRSSFLKRPKRFELSTRKTFDQGLAFSSRSEHTNLATSPDCIPLPSVSLLTLDDIQGSESFIKVPLGISVRGSLTEHGRGRSDRRLLEAGGLRGQEFSSFSRRTGLSKQLCDPGPSTMSLCFPLNLDGMG